MHDIFFVCRSVTAAQRGRDVLLGAGIRCSMMRAPRAAAPSGCAYALAVKQTELKAAAFALTRAAVAFTGPFLRLKNGEYRELQL